MKSGKRDNWLFYANPDDPRLYLYKRPKWMGVTLNFAHPRAWRVAGITVGVSLLLVLVFTLLRSWANGALWSVVVTLAVMVAGVAALLVHYFRAAERELRQHGERRDAK